MTQSLGKQPENGFLPWDRLEESVDPPILPLVNALNATGWARTVFSCAGHPEEPSSVATGRRQAHVDLVVSDPSLWQAVVSAMRRAKPRGVRIVEGG
jgi:hypothetical protein